MLSLKLTGTRTEPRSVKESGKPNRLYSDNAKRRIPYWRKIIWLSFKVARRGG